MDYFGHNERTGRKPKPGTPDVLRADFEPAGFTISGGVVVEEKCGSVTESPLDGEVFRCQREPAHGGLHRSEDTRGRVEWRE